MNLLLQSKLEGNHPNKMLQRIYLRCDFPTSTALMVENFGKVLSLGDRKRTFLKRFLVRLSAQTGSCSQ